MGDSITSNGTGSGSPLTGVPGSIAGQAYLAWATMIANGGLVYGGVSATSGFTAAQVLATHVPVAVAVKPEICVVLAGTNDSATTIASYAATMTQIYTTLLAAGIIPVACTIPPRNDLSGAFTWLDKINIWITRYARANGIPLVDFNGALAQDNGTYAAGLNADNIHPSTAGAKVMGAALWTALQSFCAPGSAFLYETQPATDTTRLVSNNLFLTDTNADGIPDNWVASAGPAYALAPNTAKYGARSGNVWTMTNGLAANAKSTGVVVTPTAGDVLYFAIKFSTAGIQAAGGAMDIRIVNTAVTNDLFGLLNFPIQDTAEQPVYTLAAEMTYPAGNGNMIIFANIRSGGGTLELAQQTWINLTTQGAV